jgi:hypothetical protein
MSQVDSITIPRITTHPIPAAIREEIETFEAEAMRTLAGDVSTDLFKPFRLQYGIYGRWYYGESVASGSGTHRSLCYGGWSRHH